MPQMEETSSLHIPAESDNNDCFEFNLPLNILEVCHALPNGDFLYVQASVSKGDEEASVINVRAEKLDNAIVRFQLLSSAINSSFNKLVKDNWQCVISGVYQPSIDLPSVVTEAARREITFEPSEAEIAADANIASHLDIKSFMYETSQDNCYVSQDTSSYHISHDISMSSEVNQSLVDVKNENILSSQEEEEDEVEDEEVEDVVEGEYDEEEGDQSMQTDNESDDYTPDDSPKKNGSRKKSAGAGNLVKKSRRTYTKSKKLEETVICRFCKQMIQKTKTDLPGVRKRDKRATVHEAHDCMSNPWSKAILFPKQIKTKKFPFECDFCPMGLSTEKYKKAHQTICPRNPKKMPSFDKVEMGLFICEICDIMCISSQALVLHRCNKHNFPKTRTTRGPWPAQDCPCRYCDDIFPSHAKRALHERYRCPSNPGRTTQKRCKLCGYFTYSEEKLNEHMVQHILTPQEHVCEICGRSFLSHRKLHCHRIRHVEVREPEHKCHICSRTFLFRPRLLRHMSVHTEERNVQCDVCGKFFKNKSQERKHMRHVHENRYPFHCEKCGHGVEKEAYLKNHICGRVRRVQAENTVILTSVTIKPDPIIDSAPEIIQNVVEIGPEVTIAADTLIDYYQI